MEKIKPLSEDQKKELRKPLPEEAVKQHPTKTYLSSIKAIYVTERMNQVFGIGEWRIKTEEVNHNTENGMVVCKVIFEVPKHGIYYESFGGNDNGGSGSKNFDLGDAYKGATTDAITKIGSYLEIGIDVFKGKNDNKKNNDLPWLNEGTPQWKNAIENKPSIEELRKHYKVSKDTALKYLQAIK